MIFQVFRQEESEVEFWVSKSFHPLNSDKYPDAYNRLSFYFTFLKFNQLKFKYLGTTLTNQNDIHD
jgi:hypothetical protein